MKSKPTILLSALALAASTILATAQDPAAPKDAPKDAGANNPGGGDNQPPDTRPGAAESAALRAVRKKGAADLAVAREDLKKVVTVRQEAVLVSMGLLE